MPFKIGWTGVILCAMGPSKKAHVQNVNYIEMFDCLTLPIVTDSASELTVVLQKSLIFI